MNEKSLVALNRPEFWLSLMALGFGGLGPEPDLDVVAKALGVGTRDGATWWEDFVGYQAEALDMPLDPGEEEAHASTSIVFPLKSRFDMVLECSPDSTLVYALRRGALELILGETGGHFRVPALRWAEAAALRAALANADQEDRMLLAMLPAIYLTTDEERVAALESVEAAWRATGVAEGGARELALQWAGATDLRGSYSWRHVQGLGWVTDAEWSVRGGETDAARTANEWLNEALHLV